MTDKKAEEVRKIPEKDRSLEDWLLLPEVERPKDTIIQKKPYAAGFDSEGKLLV